MNRRLNDAYEAGELGAVMPKPCPSDLSTFRKIKGEKMHGTEVGGDWTVFFLERIKKLIEDTEEI